MFVAVVVSLLVGASVVLQGGLNRQLGPTWGLAAALLFNSVVFLLVGIAVLIAVRLRPESFPEVFRMGAEPGPWLQWRTVVPGVLGGVIVLGMPWAITRIGALTTVLLVLVAQLLAGVLWDAVVEGIAPSPTRLAGAALALVGAYLASARS